MEDDILDNNASVVIPQEGNAYVSVTVGLGDVQTKATTGSTDPITTNPNDRDYIDRCAIFLLDENENVVGVHAESYGDYQSTRNVKFLTKYGVAKTAVAVVDYDPYAPEVLLACSSLQALENYKESNAYNRIKFGTGNVNWTGVVGSTSTKDESADNVAQISPITVYNRVAVVELAGLSVKYTSDKEPEVQLTKVWLTNLKVKGGWEEDTEEATGSFRFNDNAAYYGLPAAPGLYGNRPGGVSQILTYVYPNTIGGKYVTLHLEFSVTENGITKLHEREYIINRPTGDGFVNNNDGHTYVEPGFWYKLYATVNVKSDFVDCDVVCYTRDWVYNKLEDVTL